MENKDTAQSYWASVATDADEAAEMVSDHGTDPYDAIHEVTDGSYWVIYTHAAHKMLMWTTNESEVSEEMGGVEFTSFSDAVTKMAAWAYVADVGENFTRRYTDEGVPK